MKSFLGQPCLYILNLSYNQISDLTPLGSVTTLSRLNVAGNDFSDLEPLADNSGLNQGDIVDIRDNPSFNCLDAEQQAFIQELRGRWVGILSDCIPSSCLGVLSFGDPLIEAQVRAIIDIPSVDLYFSDVEDIEMLNVEGAGINDLSGLECLVNLRSLNLTDNQISDLSPLSGLTALSQLNLSKNQITNLTPLWALGNLDQLDLAENQIASLEGVPTTLDMQYLDLNHNQITDLTPLVGLTSLYSLDLSHNQISDLDGLPPAYHALSLLDLSYNQIEEVDPLAGFDSTYLTLNISHNNISSLEPLDGLTFCIEDFSYNSLTSTAGLPSTGGSAWCGGINLAHNSIDDIDSLATIVAAGAASLDLSNNKITDLTPLTMNPNFTWQEFPINVRSNLLDCSQQAANITALREIPVALMTDCPPPSCAGAIDFPDPGLEAAVRARTGVPAGDITWYDVETIQSLTATSASITSLVGLQCLVSLTYLDLSQNQITSLLPLKDLTPMRNLNLAQNQITWLGSLNDMVHMQTLDVSQNQISSLVGIAAMTQLQSIKADQNTISNISSLEDLVHLTSLSLAHNQIPSDISVLSGLISLWSLDLSYNTQVSNIADIAGIGSLSILNLAYDSVTDLDPLVDGQALRWGGGRLDIRYNNGFDCDDQKDNIQDLRDRQVIVVTGCAPAICYQALVFADPNLEDAIRDLIGVPTGDMTLDDVDSIGVLNADGLGIVQLNGIECLTGLTSLSLKNNAILEFKPLVDNVGLGSGDHVYITNNPYDCDVQKDNLKSLTDRGVILDVSCK